MGRHLKHTIVGKRVGKLVAIDEMAYKDQKGALWCTCKCDCGKLIYVRRNEIITGEHKGHCGCDPHFSSRDYMAVHRDEHQTQKAYDEMSKHEKLIQTYANIKRWMCDLRTGKANCKIGAIRYVEQDKRS